MLGLLEMVLMTNDICSCWLISNSITARVLPHPNDGVLWLSESVFASVGGMLQPRRWHTSDKSEKSHILVAGDAAVNDRFLAGVDDDEGKVDDGIGRGGSVCLQFCLPVPLHQILKCYLLQNKINNCWGEMIKMAHRCVYSQCVAVGTHT